MKCPFKVGDKVRWKTHVFPGQPNEPWVIKNIYVEGGCFVIEDNGALGNREVAPTVWGINDFGIEKV